MTRRSRTWWIALLLLVPTTFGILYYGSPDRTVMDPSSVAMQPDTSILFEEPPRAGIIDTTPALQELRGWPFAPLPQVTKIRRPPPPPPVDTTPPVDSIFEPTPPPPRECMQCQPTPQTVPLWVVPPLAAAVLITRAEVRTTIPEPSTVGLIAIGLVWLAVRRARR